METFGGRLKRRRQELNLSQEQLADAMAKSGKTVVSAWETGKSEPSLSDLRKLADVLKTSASWLIDGTEEGKVAGAPSGYTMVPTEEYIDLLQRVIKQQDEQK